jgi:hypothetical protein
MLQSERWQMLLFCNPRVYCNIHMIIVNNVIYILFFHLPRPIFRNNDIKRVANKTYAPRLIRIVKKHH